MAEFIFNVSIWEHDEYVITMRPTTAKEIESKPVGYTLTRKDAVVIRDWLTQSLPEIRALITKAENP